LIDLTDLNKTIDDLKKSNNDRQNNEKVKLKNMDLSLTFIDDNISDKNS